jgi:hypothetical protein
MMAVALAGFGVKTVFFLQATFAIVWSPFLRMKPCWGGCFSIDFTQAMGWWATTLEICSSQL